MFFRFSPLHHAALNGNLELISILLESQAAVDIRDQKGEKDNPREIFTGSHPLMSLEDLGWLHLRCGNKSSNVLCAKILCCKKAHKKTTQDKYKESASWEEVEKRLCFLLSPDYTETCFIMYFFVILFISDIKLVWGDWKIQIWKHLTTAGNLQPILATPPGPLPPHPPPSNVTLPGPMI